MFVVPFKGAQLRWPTVDKEAFAIVSGMRQGGSMLFHGVAIL